MRAKKWLWSIIILLFLSNSVVVYMLFNTNTQFGRLQDKINQSFTMHAENIQKQLGENTRQGLEENILQYQNASSKLSALASGTTYFQKEPMVGNVTLNLERFFRDYPEYSHKLSAEEIKTLQQLMTQWLKDPADVDTNNKLNDFLVLQQ
ncbi:hypothetical protein PAECIP112173_00279 [Paenibacillus sp. JJ-100]|uniref:hypothetical protein n=1 Tax=Paenibacillus sp. JJ-100 TaxID=2974896 RepID=UPI0022FFAE82|nr:hypothetical protein [Paenibacillus sp. JJ-100]CAI6021799.1 hypothetical protein PAECIP112173_00279 [Paenibacillus sp. JJ-100]